MVDKPFGHHYYLSVIQQEPLCVGYISVRLLHVYAHLMLEAWLLDFKYFDDSDIRQFWEQGLIGKVIQCYCYYKV